MGDTTYDINQIDRSGVMKTRGLRSPLATPKNVEYNPFEFTPISTAVGQYFDSDSKYDANAGNIVSEIDEGKSLEQIRSEQQSGWDMAANALVNNLVITGTSAIGGTLGVLDGVFSMLGSGDVSKLWDNTTSNWAVDVQNTTREAFPIYRGEEYEDSSLGNKMTSGVFWADLVQNLGYTQGMMIPGMGMASLLKNAPKAVKAFAPSFVASIGEASIESVHTRDDEVNNKTELAKQKYNELALTVGTNTALQRAMLNQEYLDELNNIEEDANNAGNFVFGSNIALLTMTNTIEFGRLFSRGYNTSRKLNNTLKKGKDGKFYGSSTTKEILKGTGRKTIDAVSEGMEEVSQGIISNTPSLTEDYNSFNDSKFNPEKRELAANIWQGLGMSMAEKVGDKKTAEEFAVGFITGLIGVPMLKRSAIPIKLENNVISEVNKYREEALRSQELAKEINTRLADNKEINAYYEGIVRNLALQDRMNLAIEKDDNFEYKNAESAQLLSDIIMFDDAGNIQELKNIINNSVDLSSEGIQSIIEETSKDGEGPFMNNGNPMSEQEVVSIIDERKNYLNSVVDSYTKNKEDLLINYPNLSKDNLEKTLFLKNQIDDFSTRKNSLSGEVLTQLQRLKDSYIPTKVQKSNNENEIQIPISNKELDNSLAAGYTSEIVEALSSKQYSMPSDQKKALFTKINDLIKINNSIVSANEELSNTINNVEESNTKVEKHKKETLEKNAVENISEKIETIRTNSTSTVSDFRNALSNETVEDKARILETLVTQENPTAKEYKKIETVNKVLTQEVLKNTSEENSPIIEYLLNRNYSNSETIDDILNKDSVHLQYESLMGTPFENTLEEDFSKIKKEIDVAIDTRIKNSNYIEKFPKPTPVEPITKPVETVHNPGDSDRGSDPTQELPRNTANESVSTSVLEDIAIGEETTNSMRDANVDIHENNVGPSSITEPRQYMRPSMSELYYGSKSLYTGILGFDFRPTYEVELEATGRDYTVLYKYLESEDAFSYVNNGNLKKGDSVYLGIDPNLESKLSSEMDRIKVLYDAPTVLLMTESGQILGNTEGYTEQRKWYVGLEDARKKVLEEYQEYIKNNPDSTDKFISSLSFDVDGLMVGRVKHDINNERSLQDHFKSEELDKVVLGIGKNNTIVTNGKVSPRSIDFGGKIQEGRLYLLIKNIRGNYTPTVLRSSRFSPTEFNIMDKGANTPVGKAMTKAINTLINYDSFIDSGTQFPTDLLSPFIYIPKKYSIKYINTNNDKPVSIAIVADKVDSFGKKVLNKRGKPEQEFLHVTPLETIVSQFGLDSVELRNPSEVFSEFVGALQNMNFIMSIGASRINTEGYNKMIISSGLVRTTMTEPKIYNNWFITDFYRKDGSNGKAEIPKKKPKQIPEMSTINNTTKNDALGRYVTVLIGDEGYYYYPDIDQVQNDGYVIIKDPNTIELVKDVVWADNLLGINTEAVNMTDNIVKTPSGKFLDRSLGQYVSPERSVEINNKLEERKVDKPIEYEVITRPKEYNLVGGVESNYIINGTVYRSKTVPLPTTIGGMQLHITREPVKSTRGDGKIYTAFYDYYVILPNGNTIPLLKNTNTRESKNKVLETITNALTPKVDRLLELNKETTVLSPSIVEIQNASTANELQKKVNNTKKVRTRKPVLSKVTTMEYSTWNKKKEVEWLNKYLPQLSGSDRLLFTKGLIEVANTGEVAWGMFDDGIITISDIATEGTLYHEAFHAVFNLMLNSKEKTDLLNEAKEIYGNKSQLELEEILADNFKEYTLNREDKRLGTKILDFFKQLFNKITNWKYVRPSINNLYRNINEGKYTNKEVQDSNLQNKLYSNKEYTSEELGIIEKAQRDSSGNLLAPNGKISNLTERQYVQVRTEVFKKWFGDWIGNPENSSKVIDENGEPLVVYHGSNTLFTEFNQDNKRYNVHNHNAFFFAEKIGNAQSYGTEIYSVFLDLKNPIYTNKNELSEDLPYDTYMKELRRIESEAINNSTNGVIMNTTDKGDMTQLQYVVKTPNQIKSATDNIGTFNTTNPDIRFSKLTKNDIKGLERLGISKDKFDTLTIKEKEHLLHCL